MYIVGDVPLVLSSTNATDSTSVSTGAIHTDGGLGVAKTIYLEGTMVPSSANVKINGGLYVGISDRPVCSGGFTQTVDGTTVVNTVVETSIVGTGVGSLTVGANIMKVGSTSRTVMGGIIETNANSETITFALYSGATQLITNTYTLAAKLTAGSAWKLDVDMIVRGIGNPGSIITLGRLTFGEVNAEASSRTATNTNNTINTLIANTFDVRITWGTASAGNSITCQQLYTTNVYQPI
jgi:hypothetical protein